MKSTREKDKLSWVVVPLILSFANAERDKFFKFLAMELVSLNIDD